MKGEDKTMFYIVAIVAIVAVIGMIIMIVGVSSRAATTSTGDSSGMAYGAAKRVVTPDHTVQDCIDKYSGGGEQGGFSACVATASG